MRVAVLAHSFPRFRGDTHGTFVKALSEALARLGHEVHALVPFDPELRADPSSPLSISSFRYVWPDRLHLLGYSRTLRRDIGMKLGAYLESPLYFAFAERALRRLVERQRIELVHAHWVLPNGFVASRVRHRTGVPYAVTLHGSDVFMAERNPVFRAMARAAVAGAAHVTSCSADLRARLLRVAGESFAEKITLVSNGTEVIPRAGADDPGVARRQAEFALGGLPADARLIVAVGRLVDKKGFADLLEAAVLVFAKEPRAYVVLGGGGELREPLEARARALAIAGRVRFTGVLSHDQVLALVAASEVFVMPSIRDPKGNIDGLPIVVLEAMAAGRPVVATDVSGMPLAVRDGVTGLLVPEKDPPALAAAILRLLAAPDEGQAMGEAGRARVATELNWDAIARLHDRLYRDAVAARRP
jgi:glycosyltransferase involved in cell wall biosynthesis